MIVFSELQPTNESVIKNKHKQITFLNSLIIITPLYIYKIYKYLTVKIYKYLYIYWNHVGLP